MLSEKDIVSPLENGSLPEMEEILGHRFRDPNLLLSALTRRSFWHENRSTCEEHNERLEFLGDAVLGLVIADVLYRRFPEDEEGELQKKRASLVNRSALAHLTKQLEVGRFVRMGRGDELSGCRDRDSVLADTLEALLAAVDLDGGASAAEKVITRHFEPLIEACSSSEGMDDCKSILQEKTQAELGITPTYRVVDEWGEDHQKTFSVAVYLGDRMIGLGKGRNKKAAAQNAAREALEAIE